MLEKNKGNRITPALRIRKSYEMTNRQIDIFSSLYKKYIKNEGFKVSLYNQNGLFKQSLYRNYLEHPASSSVDFPLYFRAYTKVDGKLIQNMSKFRPYMAPIYRANPVHKSITFSKNDLTFGILLLLSEDDVTQLKDIKIEFVTLSR